MITPEAWSLVKLYAQYYLYSDWTKSSHLALAVYRVEYIPEQSQEEQGKQSVEV